MFYLLFVLWIIFLLGGLWSAAGTKFHLEEHFTPQWLGIFWGWLLKRCWREVRMAFLMAGHKGGIIFLTGSWTTSSFQLTVVTITGSGLGFLEDNFTTAVFNGPQQIPSYSLAQSIFILTPNIPMFQPHLSPPFFQMILTRDGNSTWKISCSIAGQHSSWLVINVNTDMSMTYIL